MKTYYWIKSFNKKLIVELRKGSTFAGVKRNNLND